MTGQRISCCVPHCTHWRGDRKNDPVREGMEWICGEHWRAVPKHLRRRLSKFVRAYRREFGDEPYWHFQAGSRERIRAVRIWNIWGETWVRCRRVAIERAMGI